MKSLFIAALLVTQFTAGAQIYVPLKIVKGVATFQATAETKLSAADIHKRTIEWLEKTFLAEQVVTLDTPAKITARYFQDYTNDTWSDRFEHMLQIDIIDNHAIFTVTDTKLGLIRDGEWKQNLAKMRVMFEQGVNELFWAYEESLNQSSGKE
ncbi:MAG: hypothetical protein IPL92_04895 [Saprospiraceae bacterium]|nr:hypothetical protein [Candidatus Opimibacter iunctus]